MPECQAVFVLEQNLRNTRQIAETFQPLGLTRMRLRGGEGPRVRFVQCDAAAAVDVADETVDAVLEAGWRPQDVALLTTGSRHPEQAGRQAEGQDEYWASFWDDDQVFYGHVLGFKGLERRVIVLAVNEAEPRDRAKERLYVGLSRARDELIACGDLDYITSVGGAELGDVSPGPRAIAYDVRAAVSAIGARQAVSQQDESLLGMAPESTARTRSGQSKLSARLLA